MPGGWPRGGGGMGGFGIDRYIMAQKFYFIILQWTQKTLFTHCANMSYMYHCMRYSYYQEKLVTLRSVQVVY